MIVWRRLPAPGDRWRELLDTVRAEQQHNPDGSAELFRGSRATAARYRRRLEAGAVPSTVHPHPLDTSGLRFFVRMHGRTAALYATKATPCTTPSTAPRSCSSPSST